MDAVDYAIRDAEPWAADTTPAGQGYIRLILEMVRSHERKRSYSRYPRKPNVATSLIDGERTPGGKFAKAVWKVTVSLASVCSWNYACYHWQLKASHRMKIIYARWNDRLHLDERKCSHPEKPTTAGAIKRYHEKRRGGTHAFYRRTVEEHFMHASAMAVKGLYTEHKPGNNTEQLATILTSALVGTYPSHARRCMTTSLLHSAVSHPW